MAKTSTKSSKTTTKTTSAKASATGVATAPAVTIKTKAAATGRGASPMPSYEQIAQRAFEIWVAKGRPQGQDLENWQQAEADLMKGSLVGV